MSLVPSPVGVLWTDPPRSCYPGHTLSPSRSTIPGPRRVSDGPGRGVRGSRVDSRVVHPGGSKGPTEKSVSFKVSSGINLQETRPQPTLSRHHRPLFRVLAT